MTEVVIDLQINAKARQAFANGDFDPPVGARIRVGDAYAVGDEDGYVQEFVEGFVIGLLEGGLAVLGGERYVLDYYIDEMYLAFEPVDDGVRLAFCYTEAAVDDRDRRGNRFPDTEVTAPRDALADAILDAAGLYLDIIREYDPSAGADHVEPLLCELRTATGDVG